MVVANQALPNLISRGGPGDEANRNLECPRSSVNEIDRLLGHKPSGSADML